jgi:hypothetical protein
VQLSTVPDVHRQFKRTPVKVNAFVHCRGQFQRARIIDYSTGGLRLDGTFGRIKTDPIEIESISGVRVPGRVAWSLGAQTGMIFLGPLPRDHPALVELFHRAGTHRSSNVIVALPTDNQQKRPEK